MKKRAVNLWLSPEDYAWLKQHAQDNSTTMTQLLRELVAKKKEEHERKPRQF